MKPGNDLENKRWVDKCLLTSQDVVGTGYSPDSDGFYKNEDAKGVLSYLLTGVRYKPDDPNFSMRNAVEF
ncbi:MAG: hypothetical protein LBL58_13810, partial [Tannerellaceae bacterium]|nr:hypothetical protein [Tannerellaceae bacterium]